MSSFIGILLGLAEGYLFDVGDMASFSFHKNTTFLIIIHEKNLIFAAHYY